MGGGKYCLMCGSVKDIPVFNFPSDPLLKAEWNKFCQIDDNVRSWRLCAKHFLDDHVLQTSSRIRLKPGSIPQLFWNKIVTEPPPAKPSRRICFLCDVRDPNRRYFKFPQEFERRWEWLRICGYPSPEDAKNLGNYTFLCEIHFSKDDIRRKGTSKYCLSSNAVPKFHLKNSLFDSDDDVPEPSTTSSTVQENGCTFEIVTVMINEEEQFYEETPSVNQEQPSKNGETNESIAITENTINSDTSIQPRRKKHRFKYLGDIKDSDLQSPEKARKAFELARSEVLKCRRIIRVLRGKVIRLKKNVTKYKSMVKELNSKKNDWCDDY